MSAVNEETVATVAPLFEVRESSIQGKGAFAVQKIRKGQRIVEYTGEHISDEEADRRYDETQMRRHHTFLFTLDDETVVDGAVGGNSSIYINHSCEPNCEAVIIGNRIYIYALRAIQPNEELLYDYQYEREDDEELINFYKCLCGAPTCRGTIMKAEKKRRKSGKKGAKKVATKGAQKSAKKAAKTVAKKGAKKAATKAAKQVTKKVAKKAGRKTGVKVAKAAKRGPATSAKVARKGKTVPKGTVAKKGAKKAVKKAAKTVAKRGTKVAAKKVAKSVQRSVTQARKKSTAKKTNARSTRRKSGR